MTCLWAANYILRIYRNIMQIRHNLHSFFERMLKITDYRYYRYKQYSVMFFYCIWCLFMITSVSFYVKESLSKPWFYLSFCPTFRMNMTNTTHLYNTRLCFDVIFDSCSHVFPLTEKSRIAVLCYIKYRVITGYVTSILKLGSSLELWKP